ncbi:acyloxyacyl hydrolase [Ramlibacter algicola]|uniref:Lipid A deacylase n=1 Tax=Ramlibacter algicola TaxID=2795217 RepID=A0A934PYZ3_9BURK|nr:acyloxyacyl hydrolase [Ramlibacter algicola]MBK0392145.1 acyloxyacyl hydrolase [Ramlibacter algicola]
MRVDRRSETKQWLCSLAAATLSCAAQGQVLAPDAISLALGTTQTHTPTVAARLIWNTDWERRLDTARFNLQLELGLASLRTARDREGTVSQLSLVPVVRIRPSDRSFFLEAGIGLSLFDRQYVRGASHMASRWNFEDVLGAGVSFGPTQSHEIGLRLTHVSNGGLRKPNPGLNGVQVRYATSF